MYAIFKNHLKQYGVTAYRVGKETGIPPSTFSDWKKGKSKPKNEKLKKIADYFGVSVEYLMTGQNESEIKNSPLTQKDEREIGRDLDRIMHEIENDVNGPLYYNGEPIDEESLDLLRDALMLGLKKLKKENKVKYNPNKNKKG